MRRLFSEVRARARTIVALAGACLMAIAFLPSAALAQCGPAGCGAVRYGGYSFRYAAPVYIAPQPETVLPATAGDFIPRVAPAQAQCQSFAYPNQTCAYPAYQAATYAAPCDPPPVGPVRAFGRLLFGPRCNR